MEQMINVITFLRVERRLEENMEKIFMGNETTRIDNLAIENAINPRLNLIRKQEQEKERE